MRTNGQRFLGIVFFLMGFCALGLADAKAEVPTYKPNRLMVDPLDLLPIQLNGRWGYIDRTGAVVLPPVFMWTDYFYLEDSFRRSSDQDQLRGVWKARVIRNGSHTSWLGVGLTNRKMNFAGTDLELSSEGFAAMGRWSGKRYWGQQSTDEGGDVYILKSRSTDNIARGEYDGLLRVSDGMAAFERNGLCGFLNRNGEVAIPARFLEVRSFSDGFAAAKSKVGRDGAGWGYIDKRGEYVFFDRRGEIEEAWSFSEGLAAIKVKGRWGFMTKNFRPRIRPRYDEVRSFCDGLAAVSRDGAWGFINKSGKEVAWGFEEAHDLNPTHSLEPAARSEDDDTPLALVKQNGLYGFIAKNGDWVIEPQYTAAQPFFRGLARVSVDEQSFGYINKAGQLVWDPKPALANGIRNWDGSGVHETSEANPFFWRGFTLEPGERSEPYPSEYSVDDLLPAIQEQYVGWPKTRYLN